MINIYIILAILWCLSPLVFMPLFIIYYNKYNHLNKQFKDLMNKDNMYEKDSKSSTDSINSEKQVVQKTTQISEGSKLQNEKQPIFYSSEFKTHNTEILAKTDVSMSATSNNNDSPQHIKEERTNTKDSGVSTINIVLIVGVIFIVLAGIIFATTTWKSLPNFFRTVIIFSVTAFFFGVSVLAEKKLKLEKTSIAFYFLGSIFLPICIISAGFLKLFGSWLSLFGDGKYLLLLIASILLGGAGFIGTQKYNMKTLAYTFYACITVSIICLFKQICLNSNIFALCLAIASTVIIFVVSWILKKESEKYSCLLSCIRVFAIFNTIILGVISVLVSQNTVIASLSIFLFAFSFLKNVFNPEDESYGVFPFVILIIIGLYKLIIPENITDYMMLLTATAVTTAILGQTGQLNKKLLQILNIVSIIMAGISLIFLAVPLLLFNSWTLMALLSGTIMLINLTWLALKYKSKGALSFQPVLLIVLVQGFVSYLTKTTLIACALICVLALLAFVLYKKFALLRTVFSDVLFTFIPLICMFVSLETGDDRKITSIRLFGNYGFYMLICSIIFFLLVNFIVFEKAENRTNIRFFFEWIMPLAISAVFFSMYCIFEKKGQLFFFIYFALIILCSIFSTIFKNRKELAKRFNFCFEIYSYLLIFISLFISLLGIGNNYIYPYFWIASIFFGVKSYISHKNENNDLRNVFLYLSSAFIIGASVITTANFTENGLLFVLVPTVITIISFISFMIFTKILKKEMPVSFQFKSVFAVLSALESLVLMLIIVNEHKIGILYFVFCAIAGAVAYFMFFSRKKNIVAFIPVLIIYPFVSQCFIKSGLANYKVYVLIASITLFILIAFIAQKIHKKAVAIKKGESIIIDWLSILNILVVFNIVNGKYYNFILVCILSIYPLQFLNRIVRKYSNYLILTVSCLFVVLTFWNQPFFEILDVIKDEINVIPIVLFCIAFSYIWKSKPKLVDGVCFVITVITVIYLSLAAMSHELLIDALILAGAMLIMVILSYIKKSKKWFILSITVLIFLTVYMTRSFWLSLEWWIYLLSTGIILIVIASINEIQKQKGTSLKTKASRFMSEWKW